MTNVNRRERVDLRKFHGVVPRIRERVAKRLGRPLSNGAVIKMMVRKNPIALEIMREEVRQQVEERLTNIKTVEAVGSDLKKLDQADSLLREVIAKKKGGVRSDDQGRTIEAIDTDLIILFGRVLVVQIELDNVAALIGTLREERDRILSSATDHDGVRDE